MFDERAADRAERFYPRFLRHVKGEWARQPFELGPWQSERIVRPAFGWKDRETGFRRYRTIFVFIPRRNGKTTLAAGTAVYLTFADGEPGAEVYSAAADRDQAHLAFDVAAKMVQNSKALSRRAKVYRRSITYPASNSYYKVISSDAPRKHGFNSSGIIADELHAWRGYYEGSLLEALVTSTGSRRQPLTVIITTAGYDRKSICYREYKYACKVRDGVIDDPTYLPVIWELPPEAREDYLNPDVWQHCNPGFPISPTRPYLEELSRRALESPADLNTFLRLNLNVWTEQATRWIPLHAWDACSGELELEALEGRPCWGGLDLSSTEDTTSLALVFDLGEDRIGLATWYWIPEETAADREKRERIPYRSWAAHPDCRLELTPGNTVDHRVIAARVAELGRRFEIQEIAFDRWNSAGIVQDLQDSGLVMTEHGQGYASMSDPTKLFSTLWKSKRLLHDGDPLLRYQAAACAVKQDPAGNLKPAKDASGDRIDGIVAAIMAVGRMLLGEGPLDDPDAICRIIGV